jgi:hypothetical protein
VTNQEDAQQALDDLDTLKGRLLVLEDVLSNPEERLMNVPPDVRGKMVARWEGLKAKAENDYLEAERAAREVGIPEATIQKIRDSTARWK